jgi:hypothetical protein
MGMFRIRKHFENSDYIIGSKINITQILTKGKPGEICAVLETSVRKRVGRLA